MYVRPSVNTPIGIGQNTGTAQGMDTLAHRTGVSVCTVESQTAISGGRVGREDQTGIGLCETITV